MIKMVYDSYLCLFKVLFIADAKISFNSFRKDMVAAVNCKTIITVNPGKTFIKNILCCPTKHNPLEYCHWEKYFKVSHCFFLL